MGGPSGGEWEYEEQPQQVQLPIRHVRDREVKAHVEVPSNKKKFEVDSFIKVASNIPWPVLIFGGLCLLVGAMVILILLLKLTPMGRMISKGLEGIAKMFKTLLEWNPKGKADG